MAPRPCVSPTAVTPSLPGGRGQEGPGHELRQVRRPGSYLHKWTSFSAAAHTSRCRVVATIGRDVPRGQLH
eukprot:scaffold830_cov377-Prasinococcus_capsulatus_cf.AAC.6